MMNLLSFGLKNIGTIQALLSGVGMFKNMMNPGFNNYNNQGFPNQFGNPYQQGYFNQPNMNMNPYNQGMNPYFNQHMNPYYNQNMNPFQYQNMMNPFQKPNNFFGNFPMNNFPNLDQLFRKLMK